MLPTCREFFLTFAGVLLAGGVPVPIYPPVRADRIAEYAERQSAILRNAEARLLVTFREAARRPSCCGRGCRRCAASSRRRSCRLRAALCAADSRKACRIAQDAASRNARLDRRTGANDLALLQYTSGSTGDPKGVMLTHANLLANVRAIGEALAVRADDVGVSWLPLYHDMGLIGAWLMPLYFGLPVVVLSPLAFLTRPERWLWALEQHRGTLTAAPNFAYELAARKSRRQRHRRAGPERVRAMLNGAEPVNAETLDRFATRFARYGLRREALMPVYGLAEASLAVTVPPLGRGPRVDRVAREPFEREGRAVPAATGCGIGENDAGVLSFVSVGRPVPKHEVRIVDARGAKPAERVEGKLWFRGPSTTQRLFPQRRGHAASVSAEGQRGGLAGLRATAPTAPTARSSSPAASRTSSSRPGAICIRTRSRRSRRAWRACARDAWWRLASPTPRGHGAAGGGGGDARAQRGRHGGASPRPLPSR